jgi:hypothetical protein
MTDIQENCKNPWDFGSKWLDEIREFSVCIVYVAPSSIPTLPDCEFRTWRGPGLKVENAVTWERYSALWSSCGRNPNPTRRLERHSRRKSSAPIAEFYATGAITVQIGARARMRILASQATVLAWHRLAILSDFGWLL